MQESATECGPYDYTRSGNPTRTMLEQQLADIEVLIPLSKSSDRKIQLSRAYSGSSELPAGSCIQHSTCTIPHLSSQTPLPVPCGDALVSQHHEAP